MNFSTQTGVRAATTAVSARWKNAEVDHRVPLFRVWSGHRDKPWPELLDFWGLPNLQLINRDAHVSKCAVEAGSRRTVPSPTSETTGQAAVSGTS
jgi:hypothetical protein